MAMQQRSPVTVERGVITRTLGDTIHVWPLKTEQRKEIIFQDKRHLPTQYLKVGEWVEMEMRNGVVVYREKIEPRLPTYVTALMMGYSDDLGRVAILFKCPDLKPQFSYDVWVARYNFHWCLVRQTLIPVQQDVVSRPPASITSTAAPREDELNSTLTENTSASEYDFAYALRFNDMALRRLYSHQSIREAVYQHSPEFAHSIEDYLRSHGT
ncbi:unnamed protein product [Gongylonema pulchrum]|uniref:Cul7 domain-containing protein n=1 Tax=Gongylonema pulchrum TaxID=637853 RepID=A0A183CXB3_9BILA|nr:unnamed protein product [Gongylonema pulchrum]